jgi:type II secretory pathway pseudopilin PulG
VKKYKNEQGYTLVETLIALTLVLLFLFLVNDLLPVFLLKTGDNLKLQAITEARNQMEETMLLQNFSDINKELPKGLLLKQSAEARNKLILITITISSKNNNTILYTLKSYARKVTNDRITGINN